MIYSLQLFVEHLSQIYFRCSNFARAAGSGVPLSTTLLHELDFAQWLFASRADKKLSDNNSDTISILFRCSVLGNQN